MRPRHVLSCNDFASREILDDLFRRADSYKRNASTIGLSQSLPDKVIVQLFDEPSQRTWMSFWLAARKIGAKVVGEKNAAKLSSEVEGGDLEEAIWMFGNKGDALVVRSSTPGTAARATETVDVPVINAGEKDGEHPTQALADLYTMREFVSGGGLDGKQIAFVGNLLHSTSVRSLTYLLPVFQQLEVYTVAPKGLGLRDDDAVKLNDAGVHIHFLESVEELPNSIDVLYVTQLQADKLEGDARKLVATSEHRYCVDANVLARFKETTRLLHPLPSGPELHPSIHELAKSGNGDKQVVYREQHHNAEYVRMAIFDLLLSRD